MGVGFIINVNIAKHIYKKDRYENRALQLLLSFRGKITIQLIGIYEYANAKERKTKGKNLSKWVKEKLIESERNNYITIILGEFNGVENPMFDRVQSTSNKAETLLIGELIQKNYATHID